LRQPHVKLDVLLSFKEVVTSQQLEEKTTERPYIRQGIGPRPFSPIVSVCVFPRIDCQLEHLRRLGEFSASVLGAKLVLITGIHPTLAKVAYSNPEIVLQIGLQISV